MIVVDIRHVKVTGEAPHTLRFLDFVPVGTTAVEASAPSTEGVNLSCTQLKL